jgi:hypothetical protein
MNNATQADKRKLSALWFTYIANFFAMGAIATLAAQFSEQIFLFSVPDWYNYVVGPIFGLLAIAKLINIAFNIYEITQTNEGQCKTHIIALVGDIATFFGATLIATGNIVDVGSLDLTSILPLEQLLSYVMPLLIIIALGCLAWKTIREFNKKFRSQEPNNKEATIFDIYKLLFTEAIYAFTAVAFGLQFLSALGIGGLVPPMGMFFALAFSVSVLMLVLTLPTYTTAPDNTTASE